MIKKTFLNIKSSTITQVISEYKREKHEKSK